MQDDNAIVDGKHTQINLDFYHHDASLGKHLRDGERVRSHLGHADRLPCGYQPMGLIGMGGNALGHMLLEISIGLHVDRGGSVLSGLMQSSQYILAQLKQARLVLQDWSRERGGEK